MPDLRHQIHEHYQGQSMPPDKVESILAAGKAAQTSGQIVPMPTPASTVARVVWAIAALILVLIGGWWWQKPRTAQIDYAAVPPRIVEFFQVPPTFSRESQDPEELRAWLVAHGAPARFALPAKLRGLRGLGCRIVEVQGRPTWLACFWSEDNAVGDLGKLVHLFVARRADFRHAPAQSTPQYLQHGAWSFAAWSEGDIIYTLATPLPMERLRSFALNSADLRLLVTRRADRLHRL